MNKKQLIVAWVTGILISLTTIVVISSNLDYKSGADIFFITIVSSFPFLIIGSLLIYSFKGNQKEAIIGNPKVNSSSSSVFPEGKNRKDVENVKKEDELTSLVLRAPSAIKYYNISIAKLIVFSICSFSIYEYYWMYRNWKVIKNHSGAKISPFWRTGFFVFFCYGLFKIIKRSIRQKNIQIPYSAN